MFNDVSKAVEMRCDLHSNGVGDQVDQNESEAVMESRLMAQPQDGGLSECVRGLDDHYQSVVNKP